MGVSSNRMMAGWLILVAGSWVHPEQSLAKTRQPTAQPKRPTTPDLASVPPCQKPNVPEPRGRQPQGGLLWGIKFRVKDQPESGSRFEKVQLGAVRVEGGQLRGIEEKGTVLTAVAADDRQVQLAVCGSETSAEDPELRWYHLQYWDDASQSWENPCMALAIG